MMKANKHGFTTVLILCFYMGVVLVSIYPEELVHESGHGLGCIVSGNPITVFAIKPWERMGTECGNVLSAPDAWLVFLPAYVFPAFLSSILLWKWPTLAPRSWLGNLWRVTASGFCGWSACDLFAAGLGPGRDVLTLTRNTGISRWPVSSVLICVGTVICWQLIRKVRPHG